MAAITAAQALMYKRVQFPGARKLMTSIPGMYKFLESIDATTGAFSGVADSTLSAIDSDTFTINNGGSTPELDITTSGSTGDFLQTWQVPTIAGHCTITFPAVTSTLATLDGTEILTNKTLTTPTIGDFTNATHTHASAAQGGTLAASTSMTGTTSSSFTINNGAAVETEITITSASTTGGFTATLQVPTLAANRTITFPAVTGTLAILGDNTFTGAQTIGTGASIAGSGTGSFDMSGSTGAFTTSTGTNTLSGHVTIGAAKNLTMSGAATITTGTGAIALNGACTLATTKGLTFGSASAGTATPITMYSLTASKGGLIIAVTDNTTDHAMTLTNAACNGGAVTVTLPATTGTLASLAANQTFAGNQVVTGTLDIRGAVSSGASNPNIDFSGSSGTFKTTTGAVTLGTGAVTVTGTSLIVGNATTPVLTIESGKTNTGYIEMKGKTSGMLKITAADATAQTVTLTTAAQTSGAATITIPDLAGANQTMSFIGKAETLSGAKTFSGGILASGANANDWSGGSGTFKTSTGAVTIGNGAIGITGDVTVTATKTFTFGAAAGGTASPLTMYSSTANKGSLIVAVADAATDHATTLTNYAINGAAATITLPGGTASLCGPKTVTATTSAADSLAIPITHAVVAKTTGADGESLTLADGTPGQELFIYLAVDGGGDGVLTPTTKTGYTTITFADAGDAVHLRFYPTIGWIIVGAYGYTAPPAIGA